MAERDHEAEQVIAELSRSLPGWGRRDATDPRGLARELLIVSLVLDRAAPGDVLGQLSRAVRVYERDGARTVSALKKCASHARALLRFGRVDGVGLTLAASRLQGEGETFFRALDHLVQRVNKAEALGARVETLARARRNRGAAAQLRVLSALIELRGRADLGDEGAATEIDLIRSFLVGGQSPARYAAE